MLSEIMIEDEWERLWNAALKEAGLENASLISSSYQDPGRRAYQREDIIYKLVLSEHAITGWKRAQDLRGEFDVLKDCSGISGVPEALEWNKRATVESLALRRLRGEPLSCADIGTLRFIMVLLRLALVIVRIGKRGISHNDMCADNILLLECGGVALIDFDQADRKSLAGALIGSFLGITSGGGAKVHNSYGSLIKDFMKRKLSPDTVNFIKGVMGKNKLQRIPELPKDASAQLKSVQWAWKLAQSSDASSPGVQVAYYSYDFQGSHFPGERPWKDRWQVLGNITDFNGKRVLELGCNMALLSSSLLKEKKAKAALAVDIDGKILESAKLVASALGVMPKFRQQDLDSPEDWETELSNFKPDLVFALNVLNWVKDKDRLIRFLGRFNELIFEGHDSVEIESERFRKAGFKDIRLVTTTERSRPVLHCRK
ncbi:MAG: hypothetical protein IT362_11665 [Deltaproteobacteria bacterium]|nr:hypothetical protein [Deltaproteobacteria bacterium]